MNIRTIAGVVVAAFVGTASASDDRAKDPLVGEGSWDYAGMEEHIGTIRLTFARRASELHGSLPLTFRYIRMEPKPAAPNGFVKTSEVEKERSPGREFRNSCETATHRPPIGGGRRLLLECAGR